MRIRSIGLSLRRPARYSSECIRLLIHYGFREIVCSEIESNGGYWGGCLGSFIFFHE